MTRHAFPASLAPATCPKCGLRYRIVDHGRSSSPRFTVEYQRANLAKPGGCYGREIVRMPGCRP